MKYMTLAFALICTGCATERVFLFAPNLSRQDVVALTIRLEGEGFKVEPIAMELPEGLDSNTIFSPTVLRNPSRKQNLVEILRISGHPVNTSLNGATQYNHHYTEDNLGVYIYDSSK